VIAVQQNVKAPADPIRKIHVQLHNFLKEDRLSRLCNSARSTSAVVSGSKFRRIDQFSVEFESAVDSAISASILPFHVCLADAAMMEQFFASLYGRQK
jgi:hypothetical protein